jgi:DNA-binding transcriptional ArsR family regulator
MFESQLSDGILQYGSGFDQEVTRQLSFTDNRKTVRDRTASQVEHALRSGQQQVICSPPGSGKTYSTILQAASQSRTVVLALQTYELVEEKAHEARQDHNASVLQIESSYQKCPSYLGEHGEGLASQLRSCSLTPGRLHELSHSSEHNFSLPCTHGGDCPYLVQFDQDFDAYDLVITTQEMLHASTLTEDRDVVIDEFSKDTYVTEIENPRAVVNHYLEFIDSPLGSWGTAIQTDDMGSISSHNLQAIDGRSDWEKECLRQASNDNTSTHTDANLVVKALLAGDRYGQQIHYQLDSQTEVLITGDSAKVLQRPLFKETHSVVGLDATANEKMWQKFCHSKLDVIDVVTDKEKTILWEQSGGEVAVIGEYAHHASGGNISVKPAKQVQSMLRYTYGKTYTFSTKTVNDESSLTVDGYYGKDDKGTNSFGDADALLLVGAPHPGDCEIIETAAWFGENALAPSRDHPSEMGVNLSYGSEIADTIFSQFREKRIEQAIYRGNRMDGDGLTILSTTACLPDWMPVTDELPKPTKPGEKERAVLDAVEQLESATTREVVDHVEEEIDSVGSVSERHVRRVLTKYTRVGLVTVGKHPDDGRVTIYRYGGVSIEDIPENLAAMVRSEFHNGECPIDSASIQQTVEILMQMSWSDFSWVEWIVRQELNNTASQAAVT